MYFNSKIDPNRRVEMDTAWETFADLITPGMGHRIKLRQLRIDDGKETLEETNERLFRLDKLENSLKLQFLWSISEGPFYVYGFELDEATKGHESGPLNHDLFDARLPTFKAYWHENRIEVLGKKYLGVKFQPNMAVIQDQSPAYDFSLIVEGLQEPAPLSTTGSDKNAREGSAAPSKKRGRRNSQTETKAVIRELLGSPAFEKLRNRTAQAVEVRVQIKGEQARDDHDMAGYKTQTIARWIGEVLNEHRSGSA